MMSVKRVVCLEKTFKHPPSLHSMCSHFRITFLPCSYTITPFLPYRIAISLPLSFHALQTDYGTSGSRSLCQRCWCWVANHTSSVRSHCLVANMKITLCSRCSEDRWIDTTAEHSFGDELLHLDTNEHESCWVTKTSRSLQYTLQAQGAK